MSLKLLNQWFPSGAGAETDHSMEVSISVHLSWEKILRSSDLREPPTPAEIGSASMSAPAHNTEQRPGAPFFHYSCVFSQTTWEIVSAKPHTPLPMKTDTLLEAGWGGEWLAQMSCTG